MGKKLLICLLCLSGTLGLSAQFRTDYGAQLTGLTLSTIPILILFAIGSKSFIKGLTAGAVKS